MHCVDVPLSRRQRNWRCLRLGIVLALTLAGCSTPMPPPPVSSPPPLRVSPPLPPPVPPTPMPMPNVQGPRLPPPRPSYTYDELRLQAAQRMVAADPEGSYTGPVGDTLLAIPVLQVELNGDGSVKAILVLRPPGQAPETLQIAIEAIQRAAPYGDVTHLPKPWKFTETFLFDYEKRFKPRTLD